MKIATLIGAHRVCSGTGSGPGEGSGEESGTAVISKTSDEIQEPPMYRVLLHNDDFTPMDFVVRILEEVFHFDHASAHRIMMDVHQKGTGSCGIFPFDIAETKVALVTEAARKHEYPLKCSMGK